MLHTHEIAEEYDVTGKEVLTPKGWRCVKTVYKTVPLPVWSLRTTKHSLRCSGHHLVRSEGEWIHVRHLIPGDVVDTENGPEAVVECVNTGVEEELYDITVDDPSHAFYSSGIVSHNSTTIAARLLTSAHTIRRNSSIYITPTHPQLETFAARLKEMEELFRLPIIGQNVYKKRYKNGSKIDLAYCLTSAKDVRGKTADECVAYDTVILRHVSNVENFLHESDNLSVDIPTRICDISVGDRVMAVDSNHNIVYDRVTAKKYNGVRRCYALRTVSGNVVRATGNHQVYTGEGWLYVGEIRDRVQAGPEARREGGQGDPQESQPADGKSDRSRYDDRDSPGRRMHREPGMLLVREALRLPALRGTEGLPGREGVSAARSHSEYVEPREQRVRRCGRVADGVGAHEVQPGDRVLLGSVLQQTGGEGGRDCAHDEVRDAGLGRSADVGGRGLVDSGRRRPEQQSADHLHQLVQRGGSRPSDCVVPQERDEEGNDTREEVRGRDQHDVQPDPLQHGSDARGDREDQAVRPRGDDVQDACGQELRDLRVRALREGVQNDDEPRGVDEGSRSRLLQGLPAGGREDVQAALRGEDRSGRAEGALAPVVREQEEQGRGVPKGVLQGEQREYLCEGSSASSGRGRGERRDGSGGDMQVLREEVQNEYEDVCASEALQHICVRRPGVPQEERCGGGCKVACKPEGSQELIFENVVSVEECGYLPVYDITTETTHTFIACNTLVHNCLIDECQNFDPGILEEVLYTLTTSDRPMEVYTGTALTIDTLLEQKWQESSKGCWHVRARDGKHWLNLYDEDTLYKVCSNPIHPVCPYTGKKLIMTDGVYVHDNMKALEDGHIGLHVPQVMIPDLSDNPIRWRKIYDHVKFDDRIKVLQECFGIAVAEGSREITEQDLMYMCSMNISTEEILERCRTGYYKLIVSGCDWGGSDYNMATKSKTSYTVHCILGVAPDGGTDILYWHRYAGMQYPEIAAQIVKDHNLYHGMLIASDFGVGMAYNTELRNYLPFDRHFIMNYTGPDKEPIKENSHSALGNHLMINRTEAITNVFKDVKSIMPIIRARPWDEMKDFLKDWLHMYRIPTELPNGTKTFKYQRAATEADDALHAFTFAYVLVKVYLGQSLVQDMALENRLRAVMKNPQQAAMEYQQQQQAIFDTNYVLFG